MLAHRFAEAFAPLVEDENDLDYIADHHERDARDDAGEPLDCITFFEGFASDYTASAD